MEQLSGVPKGAAATGSMVASGPVAWRDGYSQRQCGWARAVRLENGAKAEGRSRAGLGQAASRLVLWRRGLPAGAAGAGPGESQAKPLRTGETGSGRRE